jgi:hypothetical protein
MRRIQLAMAVILVIAGIAVVSESLGMARYLTVSSDGTTRPSPFTYPSPFSAGLALIAAAVCAAFMFLLAPATRAVMAASLAHFVLALLGLWSFHRGILWMQGISGHGVPGWW